MPQTLLSLIGLLAIVAVCTFTAVLGSRRGKVAALAVLASVVVSTVVQRLAANWDPVWPLTAVDVLLLAILAGLAWRPRRGWPVWAVALQGLTVAIDLLRAAEIGMEPYTYLTAVNLSTYGLVAVIAYAGWAGRRGRRAS